MKSGNGLWLVLGGLGALVLFAGRKKIKTVGGKVVSFTADALLTAVQAASKNMPIPPYGSLPPGPPEIGPIAAEKSIEALDIGFKPRAVKLLAELNMELAKSGYVAKIVETYRSPARQAYLWGIGRLYQAPGRTGIVTKIRDVSGKHPQRKAFDVAYYRADGIYVGSDEVEKKVAPAIAKFVGRLESAYNVSWGGSWKGNFRDYPHYEDRS